MKIATRRSKLALAQADWVIELINKNHGIKCDKLLIETEGDRKLDVSLDKIGGKGLFVKDIEIALLNGEAQGAVHSMKDVPYELNDAFEIASMPVREDVRDAYVSMNGVKFKELPKGAKVGTSSIRRSSQIKLVRPDIEIVPIRGNVQTRIDKIEKENLDGIILAVAGLKRLDLECIITDYLNAEEFIPAIGQGALGIEILKNEVNADIFRSLECRDVRICVEAERSFMRRLNGGCHTLIGAHATLDGELMHIIGMFETSKGIIKKDICGNKENYLKLGTELAELIIR